VGRGGAFAPLSLKNSHFCVFANKSLLFSFFAPLLEVGQNFDRLLKGGQKKFPS